MKGSSIYYSSETCKDSEGRFQHTPERSNLECSPNRGKITQGLSAGQWGEPCSHTPLNSVYLWHHVKAALLYKSISVWPRYFGSELPLCIYIKSHDAPTINIRISQFIFTHNQHLPANQNKVKETLDQQP